MGLLLGQALVPELDQHGRTLLGGGRRVSEHLEPGYGTAWKNGSGKRGGRVVNSVFQAALAAIVRRY
jgi:hypothetical protein